MNKNKASASQGVSIPDNDSFDFSKSGNWSMSIDGSGNLHFVDHDKGFMNKLRKLGYKYLPSKWLIVSGNDPAYYHWKWFGRTIFKTKYKGISISSVRIVK